MKLLIVNFHYIRDKAYAAGIYPRTLRDLSEQIDVLSRYYEFVSPAEVCSMVAARDIGRNCCMLTFDDGLKEQMAAFDLLERKGIPAAFYATTEPIRSHKVADVHKLHYIRANMPDDRLFAYVMSKLDASQVIYPPNIDSLYRYDGPEGKRLKYLMNFILSAEERSQILAALFNDTVDEGEYASELYMSEDDLRKIHARGFLGPHGDRHLALATLPQEGIEEDLETCLGYLREICGTAPLHSVSYPFGGPKAVSEAVVDVARNMGFCYGLTMFRGINDAEDFDAPFLLKRVDTNDAPGGKSASMEYCP
jgi:peptidoglycan/xylan/chitin deacetylase (PgdA/CDA1 family)